MNMYAHISVCVCVDTKQTKVIIDVQYIHRSLYRSIYIYTRYRLMHIYLVYLCRRRGFRAPFCFMLFKVFVCRVLVATVS